MHGTTTRIPGSPCMHWPSRPSVMLPRLRRRPEPIRRPPQSARRAGARHGRAGRALRAGHGREDARHRARFLLWKIAGPVGHLDPDPDEPRDRIHRTLGMRQVDIPAHAQPDVRHGEEHACHGAGAARWRGHLPPRRHRTASPCRHGVPALEPVPEVDLRQRGVRACVSTGSHSRARSPRRWSGAWCAPRSGTR